MMADPTNALYGRNNKEVTIKVYDEVNKTDAGVENPEYEECADCSAQEYATPIEKWIQVSPQSRSPEIFYLERAGFSHPLLVTESGDVQQIVVIDKWVFLLVLNKTFPRRTEDHQIPIKMCLVVPNLAEYEKMVPGRQIRRVDKDTAGVDYLSFPTFKDEYERYLNGQLDTLLTESLLDHTLKWVRAMNQAIQKEKSKCVRRESGIRISSFFNLGRIRESESDYFDRSEYGNKYVDGRRSVAGRVNPYCKKIVLSDRAYIQIFNESQSRIQTETGGLLLGHFDDGVWYVVEASDPGINAKFFNAYHEGDDVYENHVCGVISRTYKHPLVFLGMWHRHPGSYDSFSGTDDGTNYKYAGSAGNGCISAIINYDPDFRITFYYVQQGENHRVYYTKVDVEVGDDKIPNKEMLKIASIEDVMRRSH